MADPAGKDGIVVKVHPRFLSALGAGAGIALVVACCIGSSAAEARNTPRSKAKAKDTAVFVEPARSNVLDTQLDGVFDAIEHDRLSEALRLTDVLLADHPTFRLGYLIRGDLLLAHTQPISSIGNVDGSVPNAPADRLKDLREEAAARLRAYRDKPAPNMVPRYLLQMRPDQKIAVVVDARKSRLYVYQNVNGRPRFLADYYFTQGKLGAEKSREGDQKTPIGVYHITSSLPKKKLNDFYGDGALPINYPNDWDRLNGRTGHGIWLHGTPPDTYSRPPKASDGCLVLANPDWRALFRNVQIGVTPVIISEDVEWLKIDDWANERQSLQHAIESWRADWESRDVNRYMSHYSKRFASDSEAVRQWAERKRVVNAAKAWVKVDVRNMSMLRYPGSDDMVVVTFDQSYRSNNMSNNVKKRQYWVREANRWKIIYEGIA